MGAAACLVIWVLWKAYQAQRPSPLDNIPGPHSASFLMGNIAEFFSNNAREYQLELLKKYGSIVNIKFFFGETVLLVSDPKALHHIVVKDQHIYEEPDSILTFNSLTLGPGLLSTLGRSLQPTGVWGVLMFLAVGEQHRRQRKILNPVFAISHLREMVPTFYDVVYKLRDTIAKRVAEGPQEIELLSWMSRTALELIGQSGFGYSFDGLTEHSIPHPFAVSIRRLDQAMRKFLLALVFLLRILSRIGSRKLLGLIVRLLPSRAVQEIVKIVDTMHNTSVDVIKARRLALEEGTGAMDKQIGKGKDIMSILLRANEQAEIRDRLSEEEVIAQLSTLTFAAMDTTSSALARTLWILAQHQDAQDKLRLEIREARKDQRNLTYDELMNLPYLDAVCRETLRMYPPLAAVTRKACQDAVLPLGTPIKGVDGAEMNEIFVPKGCGISINVTACNSDPKIWGSDSFEWKPERWLQSLPDSVSSARIPGVFSNLMTFIGGSRACMYVSRGFKFSQLEMKVVLLLLIESFKFSLVPGKEIVWQTQEITKPSIVGFSDTQMPMMVERAV